MFPKLFGSIKQNTWAQENGWCIEGMNRFVTALEVHWESLFDWDATNPLVGGFFFFGILLLTPRRAKKNPAWNHLKICCLSQLSPFGDSGDLGKDDVKLRFQVSPTWIFGWKWMDQLVFFHLRPAYKMGYIGGITQVPEKPFPNFLGHPSSHWLFPCGKSGEAIHVSSNPCKSWA